MTKFSKKLQVGATPTIKTMTEILTNEGFTPGITQTEGRYLRVFSKEDSGSATFGAAAASIEFNKETRWFTLTV